MTRRGLLGALGALPLAPDAKPEEPSLEGKALDVIREVDPPDPRKVQFPIARAEAGCFGNWSVAYHDSEGRRVFGEDLTTPSLRANQSHDGALGLGRGAEMTVTRLVEGQFIPWTLVLRDGEVIDVRPRRR